jgi:hypothetical protein
VLPPVADVADELHAASTAAAAATASSASSIRSRFRTSNLEIDILFLLSSLSFLLRSRHQGQTRKLC